tara:strand:- start:131 stop:352 length:222 start_codon:yes stop_codon:yes gene_type:complete
VRKIPLIEQAIEYKNPRAAIVVSERLKRMGLNYHGQLEFLQTLYPKLTPAEWEALLYAGEQDSELINYDIFKR